jgi:SAM-dependent methyltransferase
MSVHGEQVSADALLPDELQGKRRLSFGARADAYHQFRPTYPLAAVQWALGAPPLHVVEVGAGTGLMTEVLLAAGHRVTAVEPDPGMRAHLASSRHPRLTVVAGSAEELPVDDGAADAVVTAQAFHWFDLDRAVPELARVLAPDGVLAVVWNVRNDDVAWVDEMSQIVGRLDARSGTRDLGVPSLGSHFETAQRSVFDHDQELDAEALVGLVETFSYVALSPDRATIVEQIRRLTEEHPMLVGRKSFALPYQAIVYRARVGR